MDGVMQGHRDRYVTFGLDRIDKTLRSSKEKIEWISITVCCSHYDRSNALTGPLHCYMLLLTLCHSVSPCPSSPATFLIPQALSLSFSNHPLDAPFPITWLPHPSSHLFPHPSSALQLPGLPRPPPHLHLTSSLHIPLHFRCSLVRFCIPVCDLFFLFHKVKYLSAWWRTDYQNQSSVVGMTRGDEESCNTTKPTKFKVITAKIA